MKKNQKARKTTIKVLAVSISGLLLFGSGAYAATKLLNWTGDQTMVSVGIFIDQVTKKLVKNETDKNQITIEKIELEKEIEDLKQQIKDLEDEINNSNDSDEGWTEKDQQIIDLNNQLIEKQNQLIEKENQLISKQNDVEHLTRELQRANSTAITIQEKLDNSNAVLEQNGINIWN